MATLSDKQYIDRWTAFKDSFSRATPVDTSESKAEQRKRIARLEKNPEEWFRYYFPNYYSAEPAPFHKAATRRIMTHPEWFEVRAWSRELAKSARSMMEFIYLGVLGKIKCTILVSATADAACDLLMPWRACLESNQRLINDYGVQQGTKAWQADKFITSGGWFVKAIGWGQPPRGKRNENFRPDSFVIDDIDTDEECRNEDIQTNKIRWIEQALLPARSISTPTRILVNGNIIHNNCCVLKLAERADKFEVINIRDNEGKSSWPTKNTEEHIDRVLSLISYESQQKEYFNNPMDGTDAFRDLIFDAVPRLDRVDDILIYADPATSNRDTTSGSLKAIGVIARRGFDYFIVRCRVDTMSTTTFINTLFDLYIYVRDKKVTDCNVYIENNSLQNPFYEQVLYPQICEQSSTRGIFLPVIGDARDKKDKYTRIEGTLEPLHRSRHLIFNKAEHDNPDMMRLVAQFRNFSRKQRRMDGPDMVEGGVFLLRERAAASQGEIMTFTRTNNKRF